MPSTDHTNNSEDHTSSPTATAAGTITIGGDLIVNRLGFGAMRLTGPGAWGEPANPAQSRAVLRRALDLGINFIDTAVYYGPEVSNRLIVEALYPYPEDLVIATKVGARRGADQSWLADMQPERLRIACEENLRGLRLERLDIVHCRYMEDSDVPFNESVGVLAELQKEGKIHHIGLSNVTLEQIKEAQQIISVATVQNMYNIAYRSSEDVLDFCTQHGIAFMPFFPLAMGNIGRLGESLSILARQHNTTPAQIALAWLLAHSPIMLPIPGTSSPTHLEENIASALLKLSAEELQMLINAQQA